MLLKTGSRLASLFRQVVLPSPFPGLLRYLKRLLVLGVGLPILLLLQILHWFGFLLDELLFFRYRSVSVSQPVFILGVPRSGTTFLHRLLAADPEFTTFSTWECIFAPSVSERYLWLGIRAVDKRIGRPLGRFVNWVEGRLLSLTEDIHPTTLSAPEEDYLTFLPLFCCFILVVPFPEADWIWRMGRFDSDMDEKERRSLMNWYRRCVQKHLYVHGPDRTLLSKNASFAGMACSLAENFPDCRLIVCERDSVRGLESQFNSLSAGLRLFGGSPGDRRFQRRLLDCLDYYYRNLAKVTAQVPDARMTRVRLWDLSRNTRDVSETIFRKLGRLVPAGVEAALETYESRPERAKPEPTPPLAVWGIDAAEIDARFGQWRHEEAMRL